MSASRADLPSPIAASHDVLAGQETMVHRLSSDNNNNNNKQQTCTSATTVVSETTTCPPIDVKLARRLNARQVQMIAVGGTIGSGLFIGTGHALATAGPGSMLIAYAVVGAVVYLTMLALGEMAAFVPVAGSFCTFAARYVDDAFGFALTWNYWLNSSVAVAADSLALQVLLSYWRTTDVVPGWAFSLIYLVLLIGLNLTSVRVYGELEFWLSLLKVVSIIVFIIVGIAVNCGGNREHEYIGGKYFSMGEAPFINGVQGFAALFSTAAAAYGGTESITITAGETADPSRTIPKTVRNVFWRILAFYLISILIVGLDVPYTSPELAADGVRASPFTLVFARAGSAMAGSFMNVVIISAIVSGGNHALFAGARLLYTLAINRHAPQVFGRVDRRAVPWVAVFATSLISFLSFGASYIGAGQLFSWLLNIVGVSNQISWIAIGIASLRFRSGIKAQNLEEALPYRNWTYPWGPMLSVTLTTVLLLTQGWRSFSPHFKVVEFLSYYIELPLFLAMCIAWKLWRRTRLVQKGTMDLLTDRFDFIVAPITIEADR